MHAQGTPVPPGSELGRFKLLSFLGRGSFGDVYLASDRVTGRRVSLKVLSLSATDEARAGLEREGRALARLHHEAIPAIRASGEVAGRLFLALDYVEGPTLRRHLRQKGRLRPDVGTRMAALLAQALAHCHARGVLHLDLKPENLVLDPDGRPHLLDFGLAARREGHERRMGAGTPRYMAPEQLEGGRVLPATDVYQLGLVLFECLTGRPAFASREVGAAALAERAVPLELSADFGGGLAQVVRRASEPDPEDRFPSMEALLEALGRLPIAAGALVAAAPRTPVAGTRRPSGPIARPVRGAHTRPDPAAAPAPTGWLAGSWGLGVLAGLLAPHRHAWGLVVPLLGVGLPLALALVAAWRGRDLTRRRAPQELYALAFGLLVGGAVLRLASAYSTSLELALLFVPVALPVVCLLVGGFWVMDGLPVERMLRSEVGRPLLLEALAPGLGHADQGREGAALLVLLATIACLGLTPLGIGLLMGGLAYVLALASVVLGGLERLRELDRDEARILLEMHDASSAEKTRCQAGMSILTARLARATHRGRWAVPVLERGAAPLEDPEAKALAARIPEVMPCFTEGRVQALSSGPAVHLYCQRHNLCPSPLPRTLDRQASTAFRPHEGTASGEPTPDQLSSVPSQADVSTAGSL